MNLMSILKEKIVQKDQDKDFNLKKVKIKISNKERRAKSIVEKYNYQRDEN